MGGRVADGGVVRGAVDPDARRGQAHPTRTQRIAGTRWDRVEALCPGRVRREPPGVELHVDDREEAGRGRIDGLDGSDAELADQSRASVIAELVRASADDDDR